MKTKKQHKKQEKTIRINDSVESEYSDSQVDVLAIKYGYSDSYYVNRIRSGAIRGTKIA